MKPDICELPERFPAVGVNTDTVQTSLLAASISTVAGLAASAEDNINFGNRLAGSRGASGIGESIHTTGMIGEALISDQPFRAST